jgi:hypothetical protein
LAPTCDGAEAQVIRVPAPAPTIEIDIQRRTALGERTPYTTLLPSLIPQSINI